MAHAPRPPFIHEEEITSALTPNSCKRDIQAIWEKYGYLRGGSVGTFNSGHFLRGCLPTIQAEQQVLDFIESLDAEAKSQGLSQCNKAVVALGELRRWHEVKALRGLLHATPVNTVLSCLARRTCCGCHETGTYHPRK